MRKGSVGYQALGKDIRCLADDVACRIVQAHIQGFSAAIVANCVAAGSNRASELRGALPDDLGPVVINRLVQAVFV